MRYEDWDALLFEHESEIPFQEFKVECRSVQDEESMNPRAYSLPAVTCFVPSLKPGTPFRISVHSWRRPIVRQLADSECPGFEFRLFIDGDLVSYVFSYTLDIIPNVTRSMARLNSTNEPISFPCVIGNKDLQQAIRFPTFQQELLYQRHWNPADNLGRIKLVISEGVFHRSPENNRFERVKNLVIFSFQHAPQEILERLKIAWPNPDMWQQPSDPTSQTGSGFGINDHMWIQPPYGLQGQSASGYNDTCQETTTFSTDEGSHVKLLDAPMDLAMSPWGHIVLPEIEDLPPHLSTPQVQFHKENNNHIPTWAVSPRPTEALVGFPSARQKFFQVCTPSNGSVPVRSVRPQVQRRRAHGMTEVGPILGSDPARLLFGAPVQTSSQESFDLAIDERPPKRLRLNTPASAETLKGHHEEQILDPQLDYSSFELLGVPGGLI
ncbi:hypothetical protein FGRMN_2316 [Fusarium graminum]|nr:hypothetical protein FGRMN_2316 [Fusarium graminum]